MRAVMPMFLILSVFLAACGGGSGGAEGSQPQGQSDEGARTDDPASPTMLTVLDVRERSVTLAWQAPAAAPDATGYVVVRNGKEIAYTSADALSYVDTGLEAGEQYQYTVRARNARGEWSPPSRAVTAGASASERADTLPPEPPANLSVQSSSQNALTLSWDRAKDNVGVVAYSVHRDNAFLANVQGGATGYIDSGLAPGKAYRYVVKAIDAQGNISAPSPEIVAITKLAANDVQQDKTPPSAPTNLGVSAISSSRVVVTWSASTDSSGVTGYLILLNGSQIGVANSSNKSFAIEGLLAATDYEVAVVAIDAAGNRSTSSSVLRLTTSASPAISTPDVTPPSVPVDLYVEEVTSSSLRVRWRTSSDNQGVTGYEIYRDGKSAGVSSVASYADRGLSAETAYRYQVRARDAAGNVSALSVVLEALTVKATPETTADTQAPSKPGKPVVTQSGSQLGVTWSAASDNVKVVSYEVYRNGQKVATSPSTSYVDVDVQAATAYAYVVIARDAAGNASTPSDETSVKTAPAPEPPDLTPPSAPTALKVTAQTWNSVAIAWAPASDNVAVKEYEIFRNGKSLGSVAGTSYLDGVGLAANTAYTYKVRARDTANLLSDFSAELAAKTASPPVVVDSVAPTTPAGFKQAGATETSVSLMWSASSDNVGVAGYRVYRNGTLVATLTDKQLAYTGNALTTNTAYAYAVEAFDAAGNKSSSATLTAKTSADLTPPISPTSLHATNVTTSTIELAWTASTDNLGAVSYRILRGGVQVGTSSTTGYSDSGLTPATSYSYTVLALDGGGNLSPPSAALTVQTSAQTSTALPWSCGTIADATKPDGSRRLPAAFAAFSDTDKAQQRAAAAEVATAVLAALASGQSYTLPSDNKYKNLRFNPGSTGSYKPWLKISSVAKAGLVVDLAGANLWLEDNADDGYVGDAMFINASSLTIKNLSIDYDPLPFVQGRFVRKLSSTSAVIKIDDDFLGVAPSFAKYSGSRENTTAYVFDKDCYVKQSQVASDSGAVPKFDPFIPNAGGSIPSNGEVTVEFKLSVDGMFTDKTGDRVVMGPRFKPAIQLHQSANITLENINIYAFALPAIYDIQAAGQNVYRNINLVPRPGTTRLVAGIADGIHVTDAAVGPIIENSSFRAMMDDAINVHASFAPVLSTAIDTNLTGQNSSTVVIGARSVVPIAPFVKAGRTTSVDFFRRVSSNSTTYQYTGDSGDYEYLGSRTINSISQEIQPSVVAAKTGSPRIWNHFWIGGENTGAKYSSTSGTAFLFGLSSPITISDPMVAVFNHHGSGSIIRNNVFENMAVRGIVYQANTGKITGNIFRATKGPSIVAGVMRSWNEGPIIKSVEISGNQFCYRANPVAVELRLAKSQPVSELKLHPMADLASMPSLSHPALPDPISAYTTLQFNTSTLCK